MNEVSVIIPCFNCAQHLPEVVASCISQGGWLKEIIVVDDFSTDDSWGVMNTLQAEYLEKLSVFRNDVKGGNNARNLGFVNSSGQFVQWLDADDYLLPGKFESQLACFQKYPDTDVVYSDWFMDQYNENGERVARTEKRKEQFNDFLYEILRDNWSVPANYLFSRELAEKLHAMQAWNPETRVAQDREYVTLAALLGGRFTYTQGFFSVYNRGNPHSVSAMDFSVRLSYQLDMEAKFSERINALPVSKGLKRSYLSALNAHSMNACYYAPALTIKNPFSFFSIDWSLIHWKKYPFIPPIYLWQHVKLLLRNLHSKEPAADA